MAAQGAILKVLKRLVQKTDDTTKQPAVNSADGLSLILEEIEATVRPRTLTFRRGEVSLIAQVADGNLLSASLEPTPSAPAKTDADPLIAHARLLMEFAALDGDLDILARPVADMKSKGEAISVGALRAACADLADDPDAAAVSEEAAPPSEESDEEAAKPAAKTMPARKPAAKAAARKQPAKQRKPAPSRALKALQKDVEAFAAETAIVGREPAKASTSTPATFSAAATRAASDLSTWAKAAVTALDAQPILIARPAELEGLCLMVLADADHVLVASAPNRNLSHLISLARRELETGGAQ